MTTPPPRSRNQVLHDAVDKATAKLHTLLGHGSAVIVLASWPDGPDNTESDQSSRGNYFAQEGMAREWIARRERTRDLPPPPAQRETGSGDPDYDPDFEVKD